MVVMLEHSLRIKDFNSSYKTHIRPGQQTQHKRLATLMKIVQFLEITAKTGTKARRSDS